MESNQLQRSTLQRKDKDELQTIAAAMGGRPASKARKAEIIDLILELAGVSDDGATLASSEPPEDDEVNAATDVTDDDEVNAATDVTDDGESADEDDSDPGRPDETERAHQRAPARARDGKRAGRGQGEPDRAEPAQQARDDDDTGGEAGNRRRRRRRGRDRTDEAFDGEPVPVEGHLDLRDEGYGFLRVVGSAASKKDIYVSVKQIRQFGLRRGDFVVGGARPANRNEKNPALMRVDSVEGEPPDQARSRPRFEDLTPLFPDERLQLERKDNAHNMTTRIIDLVSPIGKGQRGLIVSPPKAGKTSIMKEIARSIERNHPDVELLVLLVDERPEEVTDMKRWLERGQVLASTFDRPAEEHTQVAEMAIERAKRMVEKGKDVVVM
ncbi:MAG: transcription termination factor Rho, partial [Acidimicrobiia bacterium]|nr:transcription termination factor Rho [Acidimicrobiia bacterium]